MTCNALLGIDVVGVSEIRDIIEVYSSYGVEYSGYLLDCGPLATWTHNVVQHTVAVDTFLTD